MPTTDEDPFAHDPKRWVGRKVTFDFPGMDAALFPPVMRRASGTVISQKWAGRTKRGAIPDYSLVIEGSSGKRLTVSLVESHVTFQP